MIAVIADDFTGAAEIGGIGLRYGLNVVIETEDIQNHNADLLIIATDTRSLQAKEAADRIEKITKQLLKFNPDFIFKKVDSVLRGNITDELDAQMHASEKKRAIIIAANPIFKRIIKDGIYYIDGVPLDKTSFSFDPEYPIFSSEVKNIVKNGGSSIVTCLKPSDILPSAGLIIGDAASLKDLAEWALLADNETLVGGASGFFDALLVKNSYLQNRNNNDKVLFGNKVLYVLGSKFPKNIELLRKSEKEGYYISNMPEEIYFNNCFSQSCLDNWVNDIVQALENGKRVIVSVIHSQSKEKNIASRIGENIGELIKKTVSRTEVNELLIEGGSTTSVILKHLNVKKLFPIHELETGVIRMKIEGYPGLCITTKPGSYQWPENLWFIKNNEILTK